MLQPTHESRYGDGTFGARRSPAGGPDGAQAFWRVDEAAIASPTRRCGLEEWTQMVDEGLGSGNILQKTEDSAFVEVMFAKSLDEAAGCKNLLQAREIPARVEIDSEVAKRCGIAILVPSDRLIEASELLASRAQDDEDMDDYEDDDEEDEDDFDDDDYDDEDYEDEELEDDDLDDDFDEEEGEE